MKILFILAFLGLGAVSQNAHAISCCDTVDLSSSIGCIQGVMSGVTCNLPGGHTGYSCLTSGTNAGKCCKADGVTCLLKKSGESDEAPVLDSAEAIQNEEADLTDTYNGYRNASNQSGLGRSVAAKATLDTCWNSGYSVVDAFGNCQTCQEACSGVKNVACVGLTGSDSCLERCRAVYSGSSSCPY